MSINIQVAGMLFYVLRCIHILQIVRVTWLCPRIGWACLAFRRCLSIRRFLPPMVSEGGLVGFTLPHRSCALSPCRLLPALSHGIPNPLRSPCNHSPSFCANFEPPSSMVYPPIKYYKQRTCRFSRIIYMLLWKCWCCVMLWWSLFAQGRGR